jgi:ribokinase
VLHRAAHAATVLDTTGAGDAFAAGLLSVWVAGGEPAVALDAGLALAAQVVGRAGAR